MLLTNIPDRGRFRNVDTEELKQLNFDWDNQQTNLLCRLPLKPSRKTKNQGMALSKDIAEDKLLTTSSEDTHWGPWKHAIDFLVKDGSKVLAAANGRIIEVVEHNTQWGPSN